MMSLFIWCLGVGQDIVNLNEVQMAQMFPFLSNLQIEQIVRRCTEEYEVEIDTVSFLFHDDVMVIVDHHVMI